MARFLTSNVWDACQHAYMIMTADERRASPDGRLDISTFQKHAIYTVGRQMPSALPNFTFIGKPPNFRAVAWAAGEHGFE